jgi:hypothetical protein
MSKNLKRNKGTVSGNLILIFFFLLVLYISAKVFGLDNNMVVQSFERAFSNSMTISSNFLHHIVETYFK